MKDATQLSGEKRKVKYFFSYRESTVLVDYCVCHFSVDVDDFREVL